MELEFRAYDKDCKIMWDKWVKLYAAFEKEDGCRMPFKNFLTAPNVVIMQSLGIVDKNLKKIFEEDIIRGKDHFERERFGVVKYHNNLFYLQSFDEYSDEYLLNIYDIEILGDSYQNANLLSGENEH